MCFSFSIFTAAELAYEETYRPLQVLPSQQEATAPATTPANQRNPQMTFENSNLNIAMVTQSAADAGPSSRVIEGVIRATSGAAQPEVSGVLRGSSLDVHKGATGILATALNNAGSPTSRYTPQTSVLLDPNNPNSRVSLHTAEREGYVVRDKLGNYSAVENAGAPTEQQQEALEGPQPGDHELFDLAQEEAYSAAIADVPQALYDQAIIKAANQAATTGTMNDIAAVLASTTGLPLEQMQAAQKIGQAQFQTQADFAIKSLGVDPAQLYQWARENQPEKLGRAVREQVTTRSLEGYRELAQTFMGKVAPAQSQLTRNGFETKTENGTDMVNISGMWTTVKAAARMGLI